PRKSPLGRVETDSRGSPQGRAPHRRGGPVPGRAAADRGASARGRSGTGRATAEGDRGAPALVVSTIIGRFAGPALDRLAPGTRAGPHERTAELHQTSGTFRPG